MSNSLGPHDYTAHGIFVVRILEWVAFPFSRASSQPRSPTLPALQADSLPAEPQGKPKNTWVGALSLLQWIFPTQELNWGLLHCRQTLYQLNYQGNTNNILSEKELHFQKKKLVRRIGLFYIFENLFKLWLKEASWILISAFAFNLWDITHYEPPENSTRHSWENEIEKKQKKILVLL